MVLVFIWSLLILVLKWLFALAHRNGSCFCHHEKGRGSFLPICLLISLVTNAVRLNTIICF